MRPQLKIGNRANHEGLQQLGYKRLSSSQWLKDGVKVQVIGNRIHNIQNQTHFHQPIFNFKSKNGRCETTAKQVVKCLR